MVPQDEHRPKAPECPNRILRRHDLPEIELTAKNCPILLQRLVGSLGLSITAGLRMASGLQLGSENRVEILLDSSCDFARKSLDQADNRSRIEAEIFQLTGRSVSVALRLTAPAASPMVRADAAANTSSAKQAAGKNSAPDEPSSRRHASPKTNEPAPVPLRNLMGEVDPASDRFVREVMEAFGATVVRITTAPAVQTATNTGDESDVAD